MSRMNGLNMRNSKMKILLYCAVVAGLLLTIYLLSSTHSRLKDIKGAYEICQQQKDSLLAQLQVVYEQKSRVEKVLQQEKLDHKKTKEDDLQKSESNSQLEKDKTNLESKLSSLQQEEQSFKSQVTQLKEKLAQNEEELNRIQSEKENSVQNKETEISNLKSQVSNMVLEREQLQHRFDTQQSDFQHLADELHSMEAEKARLSEQLKQKSRDIKFESTAAESKISSIVSPNDIKDATHLKLTTIAQGKQNQLDMANKNGGGLNENTNDKLAEQTIKQGTEIKKQEMNMEPKEISKEPKETNELPQAPPPMEKKPKLSEGQPDDDKETSLTLNKRENLQAEKVEKQVLPQPNEINQDL